MRIKKSKSKLPRKNMQQQQKHTHLCQVERYSQNAIKIKSKPSPAFKKNRLATINRLHGTKGRKANQNKLTENRLVKRKERQHQ